MRSHANLDGLGSHFAAVLVDVVLEILVEELEHQRQLLLGVNDVVEPASSARATHTQITRRVTNGKEPRVRACARRRACKRSRGWTVAPDGVH